MGRVDALDSFGGRAVSTAAVKVARDPGAAAAVAAVSFLAGSVPFSQIAARRFAGADLRRVGSGTVSGTALYDVAGFWPLAAAGILEVAKGAVGPALARRAALRATRCWPGRRARRGHLGALAACAAIAGHDWTPWLGGAGGRGLSPAMGATLVLAPEGTAVLVAGMAVGRLVRQSGVATLLASLALPVVLGVRRGTPGAVLGLCICVPMLVKRVLGNSPLRSAPGAPISRVVSRLVFDRDPAPAS